MLVGSYFCGLKGGGFKMVPDEDFRFQLQGLAEEFETLNGEARELETAIVRNIAEILE